MCTVLSSTFLSYNRSKNRGKELRKFKFSTVLGTKMPSGHLRGKNGSSDLSDWDRSCSPCNGNSRRSSAAASESFPIFSPLGHGDVAASDRFSLQRWPAATWSSTSTLLRTAPLHCCWVSGFTSSTTAIRTGSMDSERTTGERLSPNLMQYVFIGLSLYRADRSTSRSLKVTYFSRTERLLSFPATCVAMVQPGEQVMKILQNVAVPEIKLRLYRDQVRFVTLIQLYCECCISSSTTCVLNVFRYRPLDAKAIKAIHPLLKGCFVS